MTDYTMVVQGPYFAPWMPLPVQQIKRRDVMDRYRHICTEHGVGMANKSVRVLSSIFNYGRAIHPSLEEWANPIRVLAETRTKRIMPKFGPFDRAAGEQVIKLGVGSGAFVAVSRIEGSDPSTDLAQIKSALSRFLGIPDIVGIRLMRTDRGTTAIKTQEKTMRTGVEREGAFDYLLVAEALSDRGARAAKEQLDKTLKDTIPGYQSHDSSTRRMIYGQCPHEAELG
jgi:hypothetical protein